MKLVQKPELSSLKERTNGTCFLFIGCQFRHGLLTITCKFLFVSYLSVNLNIMHEFCINIIISLRSTLLSYLTIPYDPYFITNDHSYSYFNTTFMTLHKNATSKFTIQYIFKSLFSFR